MKLSTAHFLGTHVLMAAIVTTGMVLAPKAASALVLNFGDNIETTAQPPAPDPNGIGPWLVAEITNANVTTPSGTSAVTIKLTPKFYDYVPGGSTTPTNTITQLAFNLSNVPLAGSTTISKLGPNASNYCTVISGSFSCTDAFSSQNDITSGVNNQNINGAGGTGGKGYDLLIDLPPPGGNLTDILSNGDIITLTIYGPNLTEASFNAINVDGYLAAAKVQRINCIITNGIESCGSTVIGSTRKKVPAPLPILGAAAAFAYSRRIRQRIETTPRS